jgi:DNA-binding protein HU-beta
MTKEELIQAISKKTGISKTAAGECFNVVFDEITKALSQGEEVSLPGFGKFGVSFRKERMGINPQTKEKITIQARKTPRFKAGKILKDAVR